MRSSPDRPASEGELRTRTRRTEFLNLPNLLTLSRILLIPFFVAMMIRGKTFEAFLIIVAAGVTDVLDGWAARTTHHRTDTGAFLDPAADKLMMTTCFIVLTLPRLSIPNAIPLWLTAVVVGRDMVIALGALALLGLKKIRTVSSTILGKSSTVCQVITIWLVVLFNYLKRAPAAMKGIYLLTLAITCLSGIQYVFIGIRSLKKGVNGKG